MATLIIKKELFNFRGRNIIILRKTTLKRSISDAKLSYKSFSSFRKFIIFFLIKIKNKPYLYRFILMIELGKLESS